MAASLAHRRYVYAATELERTRRAALAMLDALRSISLCTDCPAIRNIAKEGIAQAEATGFRT